MASEPTAQPAPTKREKPWSAIVAGGVIALLSLWFYRSLDVGGDARAFGSASPSARETVLGLNDEATRKAEADVGRSRPAVRACHDPKPGQPPPCSAGQRAFCDADGQALGCCAVGMVPKPSRAAKVECVCAPGGASRPEGESAACAAAAPWDGAVDRGLAGKRDKLALCRTAAEKRGEKVPAVLDVALRVAPEGALFDVELGEAGTGFTDCAVSWIETVVVAPPPDGDARVRTKLELDAR